TFIIISHLYCALAFPSVRLPPPISTLFPYTTLFRSHPPAGAPHLAGAVLARGPARPREPPRRQPPALRDLSAQAQHLRRDGGVADRKSTRLNSSHVKISYAVFCLKKKKEKDEEEHPQ